MGVKLGIVYSVSSVGQRASEYSLSHSSPDNLWIRPTQIEIVMKPFLSDF